MPKSPDQDSDAYLAKKRFFDQLLTVYGRKPVMEALQSTDVKPYRLHLAQSNRPAPVLEEIKALAEQRGAEVVYHSRQSLARISKNSKQDQGVAVDIHCPDYQPYNRFLQNPPTRPFELLALDRITNPQNLGLIVRSVCAGHIDGLLLPKRGCAQIDPLVIKASAGTLFKTSILRCEKLGDALADFRRAGCQIYGLSSHASTSIAEIEPAASAIYVLGNETDGISPAVAAQCNDSVAIPMSNGVESLNVAVAASLLAFRPLFTQSRKP